MLNAHKTQKNMPKHFARIQKLPTFALAFRKGGSHNDKTRSLKDCEHKTRKQDKAALERSSSTSKMSIPYNNEDKAGEPGQTDQGLASESVSLPHIIYIISGPGNQMQQGPARKSKETNYLQ